MKQIKDFVVEINQIFNKARQYEDVLEYFEVEVGRFFQDEAYKALSDKEKSYLIGYIDGAIKERF